MQEPKIISAPSRTFVGHCIQTTLSENRTFELWSNFKPRQKEISKRIGTDFFSMQVFSSAASFAEFTPHTPFEKWAAVEVASSEKLPEGMGLVEISSGLYAIFIHKGTPATFPNTLGYIYGVWLPKSGYTLDDRPHFEVLGEKYKMNSADSEEEVWIPVR